MVTRDTKLERYTIQLLSERGVELEDIARLVTELQAPYNPQVTDEMSIYFVERTLRKREVQHTVITGIEIDKLAEKKMLSEPLQSIVEKDLPLYGADESLALAIVHVYGSVGITNFGYLDKLKPGIIGQLDKQKEGKCNTYLDDLVGAIAAAAASSLAHSHPNISESFH